MYSRLRHGNPPRPKHGAPVWAPPYAYLLIRIRTMLPSIAFCSYVRGCFGRYFFDPLHGRCLERNGPFARALVRVDMRRAARRKKRMDACVYTTSRVYMQVCPYRLMGPHRSLYATWADMYWQANLTPRGPHGSICANWFTEMIMRMRPFGPPRGHMVK